MAREQERLVQSQPRSDGSMSFSKMACRSSSERYAARYPPCGVQVHLPVALGLVHVEEDREAVVEALAADAPLVDERLGVRLGLAGAAALRLDLRVDDDLGTGAVLDVRDRLA